MLLNVEYVDYGNDETLPIDRICLLEDRFSTLPRQAMFCVLPGVDMAPDCVSDDGAASPETEGQQVLRWLHSLIAEKPVNLIVLKWLEKNRVEVDVYVQIETALSSQSLATLPLSIPVDKFMLYAKSMNCSSLSLLLVMQTFGLAVSGRDGQQSEPLLKGKNNVHTGTVLTNGTALQITHQIILVKVLLVVKDHVFSHHLG